MEDWIMTAAVVCVTCQAMLCGGIAANEITKKDTLLRAGSRMYWGFVQRYRHPRLAVKPTRKYKVPGGRSEVLPDLRSGILRRHHPNQAQHQLDVNSCG